MIAQAVDGFPNDLEVALDELARATITLEFNSSSAMPAVSLATFCTAVRMYSGTLRVSRRIEQLP